MKVDSKSMRTSRRQLYNVVIVWYNGLLAINRVEVLHVLRCTRLWLLENEWEGCKVDVKSRPLRLLDVYRRKTCRAFEY